MKILLLLIMCMCLIICVRCQASRTGVSDDERTEEIVIDEVVDDHIKQHILLDRNYNSSFTISVPMLSVIVPGTSKTNGVIKFSISHVTLWSLVTVAFTGLVYPIFLGPHGKLHKRSFDGRSQQPLTFFDHLENLVNISAIKNDITALIPLDVANDCLQRTVCEAHQGAAKYGFAGLTLRSLFPDTETNIYGMAVDEDLTEAAKQGIEGLTECEVRYRRCLLSPLSAYQKAVSYSFFEEDGNSYL